MILDLKANTRLILAEAGLQVDLNVQEVVIRAKPPGRRPFRHAALAAVLIAVGAGAGFAGGQIGGQGPTTASAEPVAHAADGPAVVQAPRPPAGRQDDDPFGLGR